MTKEDFRKILNLEEFIDIIKVETGDEKTKWIYVKFLDTFLWTNFQYVFKFIPISF